MSQRDVAPMADLLEYNGFTLTWALWRDNQGPSYEESKAIRDAETLSEAVALAREFGYDVERLADWEVIEPVLLYEARIGIGNLYVDQYLRSAGISHMGQLNEDLEAEVTARHFRQTGEPVDVTTEVQSVLEDNLTLIEEHGVSIQERYDTTVPEEEEEEEETFSKYLFPDWAPGIDPTYHVEKLIRRDDYSPWPYATRKEVVRYLGPEEDFFMKDINYSEEDKEYWRNQFAQPGGYLSGQEILIWSQFTPDKRASIERQMVEADLLDPDTFVPGSIGFTQLEQFRDVLAYGNYLGVGWNVALQRMGVEAKFRRDNEPAPPRGPGRGVRASFSVPASLRTVPDYESAEQETRNILRNRLGRDPEDWELGVLADNILGHYRDANTEKIKAARAAFNQAQRGISGDMEIEVPNPQLRTQAFIEDRYSAEIDRTTQVGDTSVTNRLMLEAITRGAGMVS